MAIIKQLDLKSVEQLASLELTEQHIVDSLGISRSNLSRMKTEDETSDTALRKCKAIAIAKVSCAVINEVERGSLRTIIFYLKCRAGWR